jgi:hypothetical protein
MFDKDDRKTRLALSLSPLNDERIVTDAGSMDAERLHQLAMNPRGILRREAGIPKR